MLHHRILLITVVLTSMILILFAVPVLAAPLPAPLATPHLQQETAWFDQAWLYRVPVTIANPCGQALTDYQVQVTLDATFVYSHARGDGADLRFTTSDGITLIPFWIEAWNPPNSASIWIKVPSVPAGGATVYLYYGNPAGARSGTPVESPPIGPWTKAAGNPIIPIGRPSGEPQNGTSLLAEDMVYDSVTGHYWLVFANYSNGSVGLVWSDDPGNPASWHWQGTVVNSGNAPHLLQYNGTWYLFYSTWPDIRLATASSVTGPYTSGNIVLSPSATWETARVDEPYIFQRNDGKWVMIYMGDAGSTTEQVGYATADNITGPYTKHTGNPVLAFGPTGSFDAGTVADPWVVEFHGVYYIGYTVSPSKSSPWQTAFATTTDWQTFTKHNIILPLSSSGWDSTNTFRGAVTRFGNTYYFPYTGDGYQMGIATQPVYAPLPDMTSNRDAVFNFYDDFNATSLDTTKWTFDSGLPSQVVESGGVVTLTATGTYIKIHGQRSVGMDYLAEFHARHPQAGTNQLIAEVGLVGSDLVNAVRIADDFHNTANWERQANNGGADDWVNMAQPADSNWHIFRTYRLSPNVAGFQIDDTAVETTTTKVPTINLPAFLMSYGSGSQLVVDWARLRKWCGAPTSAQVGTEEPRPNVPGLMVSKTPDIQFIVNGADANFTITLTNTGNVDLVPVTLEDALAPDCSRTFATLAVGASASYICVLNGLTTDMTNTVAATGTLSGGGWVTATDTAFVDVVHPSIALAKLPDSQTVISGATAWFTLVVTNMGDVALTNVMVTDASAPDCNRTFASLAAGASTNYICQVANAQADFSNSATATGTPPVGSNVTATATATVVVSSPPDAPWFDPGWTYRRRVVIGNPCGQVVTDYQTSVMLDSSFDFGKALSDGSDLLVTSSDGTTLVPFWIETWNPGASQAKIWVKAPSIPLSGTLIYLYYGNPTPPGPPQVEIPPIGPWTKAAGNPIAPIGGPANGRSLLAEDMVYDDVTGHYWLVFANYNDGSVGLAWSDEPGNTAAWHWYGAVVSGNAPHLMQVNGTWYLFYSTWPDIRLATASSVTGPYTSGNIVLSPSETWETKRVDEPYIFQRNDGKWIMIYMADEHGYDTGLGPTERVGYATADNITGPFVKFAGNPVLDFGLPGSFDAGTIADPWVVEFHGVYYIGYTVSPSKSSPWQTALATTTDWQTFTKQGVLLPLGPSGAWDNANSFRGAVTRFGNTYYFPYTGDGYQMGLATQSAFRPMNDPNQVFSFFDAFNGTALDASKWTTDLQGAGGSVSAGGGVLTLTSQSSGGNFGYVQMWAAKTIATGSLLEAAARHLDAALNAGTTTPTAAEVGYSLGNLNNIIRIFDYPDLHRYTINATAGGTSSGDVLTGINYDTGWHTYRVYRTQAGTAEFRVDGSAPATLGPPYVPTTGLSPWLMSYAEPPAPQSRLEVDWIRVRNWCGAEADSQLGAEEHRPPQARITLTKTPDTQMIRSGSEATFSIAVTNAGDAPLTDVAVTDDLAPDCARSLGALAIGASTSYVCALSNVTDDLTNRATVTGTVSPGNVVTATDTAFVDVIHPAIALAKTPHAQTVISGATATFNIVITNTGDVTLTNVTLVDTLAPDCDRTLASLNAGASTRYACTSASVTADLINSATVTGAPPVGAVVTASDAASVTVTVPGSAAWFDLAWGYRRPVVVGNPCGQTATDYQVMITLDSSFDFGKALNDGSDLRITRDDGVTLIPFWVETWNPGSTTANIWVKVPSLPTVGAVIYVYYGNPTPAAYQPAPVPAPPTGPFTRSPGNPFTVQNAPYGSAALLPEKLVFANGQYWVLTTDRGVSPNVVSVISSTDLINWTYAGVILSADIVGDPGRDFDAPAIVQYGGTWYVVYYHFHGGFNESDPAPIGIAHSTSGDILGPYVEDNPTLLTAGPVGSWDDVRVAEPYLIQRDNGDWVLVYMGDSGGYTEQVGIAISTNGITGTYVKSTANPVIAFGLPGSLDAGTVADPWVVKFGDTYYIGYTASPTKASWNTTYATTKDWVTFTKSNQVILNQGPAGSWDQDSSFRGAVTLVGDTYLFPYTGIGSLGGYRFGIATQPTVMTPTNIVNNPDAVFDFYDSFSGTQLDASKWSYYRSAAGYGTATVSSGILSLTASGGAGVIELVGTKSFGPGTLLESRARHPDADGTETTAAEVGFGDGPRYNMIRILDYNQPNFIKNTAANQAGGQNYIPMNRALDPVNWLLHRIYWVSNAEARFSFDSDPEESVTANIPGVPIPPWLMAYSNSKPTTLLVDWLRVREWCGTASAIQVGGEQLKPSADLAVVKSDSPDPVTVGSSLTYQILVANHGPSAATGVTLTDALPSEIILVSATPSQGTCSGTSILTCSLGNLANGATAMVTLVVTPTAVETITNTVSVASDNVDLALANNTAQASTSVSPIELPLNTGWNLISLPLVQPSTRVTEVLASLAGHYDLVYTYEGCGSGWHKYDATAAPYASDLTDLDHTVGLWVRVDTPVTLTVRGSLPASTTIPLCSGWNLAGYPSLTTRNLPDVLNGVPFDLVYAYDAFGTGDPWLKYAVNVPPYANNLAEVKPTRGYWLRATANGAWIVQR